MCKLIVCISFILNAQSEIDYSMSIIKNISCQKIESLRFCAYHPTNSVEILSMTSFHSLLHPLNSENIQRYCFGSRVKVYSCSSSLRSKRKTKIFVVFVLDTMDRCAILSEILLYGKMVKRKLLKKLNTSSLCSKRNDQKMKP